MTDLQARLLSVIQESIPLVREPFAEIARRLETDEQSLLDRIAAIRGPDGLIREISAIFDAAALGYQQALVALRVPPERLDDAGRLVASHPGVSHCYGRQGKVNLWFTLAVSPRSSPGLAGTADLLARLTGGRAMVLPTLRRYKLHVRFAAEDEADDEPDETPPPAAMPSQPTGRSGERRPPVLSDEQVRAIRALQGDLPCRRDPFAPLAAGEGLSADMLLVHAADFLAAGYMRRYAAVLRHRAAGAKANLLVAWAVQEPAADAAAGRCTQLPAVSHCYLRPTGPDWPYNLYTMIHGRNEQDCGLTVDEIATTTGLDRRVELWTRTEYKKQRVRLFTADEAEWEQANR